MASRQGVESKISRMIEKLISKRQIYSGKWPKDQITQIRRQQAGLRGAGGVPYLYWMSGDKITLKSTETCAKTQEKRFDSPQNAGVYVKVIVNNGFSQNGISGHLKVKVQRGRVIYGASNLAAIWSQKS